METSKTLTATCYCKSIHYTLTLPSSSLPIPVHLCHCSRCRYMHGSLCAFHAPIPAGVHPKFIAPSSLESSTTQYTYPKAMSKPTFCTTCGCHMGDYDARQDKWFLATALFPKDETVFIIKTHIYTLSPLDGGAVSWLKNIGDRELEIAFEDDGSDTPNASAAESPGADGEDRLRAQCHCGGVSFTIPRPTPEVLADETLKPFTSPLDSTKWIACVDPCNDCRLNSGAHIAAWTFVPLSCLSPAVGEDLKLGTSKTYESSPGVQRSFCGVCGATVFYWDTTRSKIVDVAIGLLRAPEGVRAENWLTWRTHRVGHLEAGREYDKELYDSLAAALEKWGDETYGQRLEFPIG
ncbi:DUF636 domain protein [Mycena leptocephala]|nr:DUF636 domain protein [Mycena leptocephala]